jgi:hypothetical protein
MFSFLRRTYSPQRFFAAARAISARRSDVIPSARFFPPMRPSWAAAWFFPVSGPKSSGSSPVSDAHNLDGVADHVGGAALAFGASRHPMCVYWEIEKSPELLTFAEKILAAAERGESDIAIEHKLADAARE